MTMKKTFRFLTLGLMLLGGTLGSWAADPVPGTFVGATVSGGVVTYEVTSDPKIDGAIPVQITGLDADGIAAQQAGTLKSLDILTTFQEKFGTEYKTYYVVRIIDASSSNKVAFYAMNKLESLTFKASDDTEKPGLDESKFTFTVGTYAFYGCEKLKTLVLPDNVKEIGKYAFQKTAITDFKIPAKCEKIGQNAFYNTTQLKTVSVGVKEGAKNEVMTELSKQVFANSAVKELDLTNATKLTTINDEAFIYQESAVNNSLKTIKVPETLATIGIAFANLTGLETIEGLDKTAVTDFVEGAFQNDEALKELNFPKGAILYAGTTSPFLGCKSLATLTFADGWSGYINPNLYISTNGKKKIAGGYETYTVSADRQKAELGYLKKIEFKGAVYGDIGPQAFGNYDATLACSALAEVKYDGTIYGGAVIGGQAFENCAALATLTFADNSFAINKDCKNDIEIGDYAFHATALTAVDFKNIALNSENTGGNGLTINPFAFAIPTLKKVNFGNITLGGQPDWFYLKDEAFVSDVLTEVAFKDVTASNKQGIFQIGDGSYPVFEADKQADKGVLTKVTFGKLTAGDFVINDYAFMSEVLATVTIGGVTTATNQDGDLYVGFNALGFYYDGTGADNSVEKTVTIGDIDEDGTGKLSVEFDDGSFMGNKLKTVTIGKIGANDFEINDGSVDSDGWCYGAFASNSNVAKTVTIGEISGDYVYLGDYAFYGDALTNVTTGDISGKKVIVYYYTFGSDGALATVNIGNISSATEANFYEHAFYAGGLDTPEYEPLTTNVTIGNFDSEGLYIDEFAFSASQKAGSTLNVKIGNISKKPKQIKNYAFYGAGLGATEANGTTTFTLGDIAAEVSTIDPYAFYGSYQVVDGNDVPNTTVKIGKYNNVFKNNAFFWVDALTVGEWNVSSQTLKFRKVRTITVEGDVTADLNGDGTDNTVETIILKGNVSGKIGNSAVFGKNVREIRFDNNDPEVVTGAIKSGAFAAASNAAKDDEKIVVVYKVETAIKSNKIFENDAFGTDDAYVNVILYTDEWSKANTFENLEILANHIWRLSLSASEIVPGDDILAKCVAQSGGKYAYGKLFVPKGSGMKYYVDAEVADDVTGVNLFSATIDGTDIRMKQVDIIDGCYWIDATERDQVFVVRTSATRESLEVEAQAATDDIIAAQETLTDDDWFDASLGKKNALRYTPVKLENQELRDFPEFEKKGIYVMANPKNRGLAFALLNQYDEDKEYTLAAKSVYVLTKKDAYARELNVIWDDDSEATGISTVKNEENSDVIYNLQGARVNKAQKGVFIINGKKVVK